MRRSKEEGPSYCSRQQCQLKLVTVRLHCHEPTGYLVQWQDTRETTASRRPG